jgi:hypothetical protein
MVKCFAVSEHLKQTQQTAAAENCDNSDDTKEEVDDEETSDDDEGACQLDNLNEIFERPVAQQMDEGVVLPSHMRCCSHTLDLVATTDAEVALSDQAYKKVHRSSMAKTTAIWNATSRSTKAADAAYDIVKHRFVFRALRGGTHTTRQ